MIPSWLVTPYFFDQRDAALKKAVPRSVSFTINDPGGITDRSASSLARLHRPIAEFVASAVEQGNLPISVAGDCGAGLPVMAGLQKAGLDPVLVWLDAHGDFNTIETSPSGFLGGMPLAMMVGPGDMPIPEKSGLSPVAEKNVWLIGARDLDPLEALALEKSRIHRMALDGLADLKFDRPVYLHIDNDIVDAREVPANNYPVAGGPSLEEVIRLCTGFAARNSLCAVSLSGWNGQLDEDGKTSRACRLLLASVLASAVEAQQ
ncbi:Arginase [hydrothermal vent metagenome]|uniref:Arginase n=1 Tax=hydrothermal vent metagenome TaxID=652676 RepID=A0A3B0RRR8_9ZZZZ